MVIKPKPTSAWIKSNLFVSMPGNRRSRRMQSWNGGSSKRPKPTSLAISELTYGHRYSEGRGVPLHRTVYPGMPVPEREYFKDFLRYYIATHEGLLRHPETGKRRPSPSTRTVLKQASRWYFGFEMRTGTTVGEEYRAEIRLVRFPSPQSVLALIC